MQGYLDNVGLRSLLGWAMDEGGALPRLIATVDGQEVARFSPSAYRPDLASPTRQPVAFEVDLGRELAVGATVAVTDEAGAHIGNSPFTVNVLNGTRVEKALAAASRDMKILEIGPSYSPLTPRSRGWNSFSLDHASQEELKAKYAGQLSAENIEPVDFLWRGGPVETAIPVEQHGTFDVVLASHVIEHFPDTIGFYLSARKLLKPNGLISLVVPDKRVTFDFFKPVTLTSDLLAAHHERRTRHTRKTAFDNAAYNAFSRGQVAWAFRPFDQFTFPAATDTLAEAKRIFDETVTDETGVYSDYHNTIYTPAGYALSILELGQLGIIPFEVVRTFPTEGCEFFVTLRASEVQPMAPDQLANERLRLMKETVRELGEQARWLTDD